MCPAASAASAPRPRRQPSARQRSQPLPGRGCAGAGCGQAIARGPPSRPTPQPLLTAASSGLPFTAHPLTAGVHGQEAIFPRGRDLRLGPGGDVAAGRAAPRAAAGGGQLAGCRARTQGGFSSRGQAGQVLTLTAGTVSPGSRQELFPVPRLRQVLSTWRPSGHRGRSCAPPGAAR
jgi:hypothetical protein